MLFSQRLSIFALAGCLPALGADGSADAGTDSAWTGAELAGGEVAVGRDAADGARVLGRVEIERAASLADLLRGESGVLVRSTGGLGGYSQVSLRGAPCEQVEVTLDGVPLGGSTGSSIDVGPFALDGLDRIEIRQAAGTGAPRLDLRSRRGWSHLGGSLRVGSFGERAVSGWWGDPAGRAVVSAWREQARNDWAFPWDNGTEYNTADDGVRHLSNNDFAGWGAAAAWRPLDGLDASLRWEGSDRGLSTPLLSDPHGRWKREALQGALRRTSDSPWGQDLELSWRRFASDWSDSGLSSGWQGTAASRERGDDLRARWSTDARSASFLSPRVSIESRWERSRRRSVGDDDVSVTPDGSRLGLLGGAGLAWAGQGGKLGADLDVRGDLARDERDFTVGLDGATDAADSAFWRRTGRAALSFWTRSGESRLRLSGSFRGRLPDFQEWMGSSGGGLANVGLSPERSFNAELAGSSRLGLFRAETAVWASRFEDPIQSVQAGTSPFFVHQNGPGYAAAGFDAAVTGTWRGWDARVSGTCQRAAIDDPNPSLKGNEPRRFPRWTASAGLSWAPVRWASLGYDLQAQGATWATELNTSDDRRSGRALHGIWLRLRRGPGAVTLSVRNLTDVHPEDLEDLPLSGRQYQARLELDFASPSLFPSHRKQEHVTQENPS